MNQPNHRRQRASARSEDGLHFVGSLPAGPIRVPLLPLAENVVFPGSVHQLLLKGEEAASILEAVTKNGGQVALFLEKETGAGGTDPGQLHNVGVLARLVDVQTTEDGTLAATAEGVEVVRLVQIGYNANYVRAEVEPLPSSTEPSEILGPLVAETRSLYLELLSRNPEVAAKLTPVLEQTTDPHDLAFLVASTIPLSIPGRQRLLEVTSAAVRLQTIQTYLRKTIELTKRPSGRNNTASQDDAGAGHSTLTQSGVDIGRLDARFAALSLTPEAREIVNRELGRLAAINPLSPEHGLVLTYLELLSELPWQAEEEGEIDLKQARVILDRDHYGVHEVKDRIIESLAVRKLRTARGVFTGEEDTAADGTGTRQPVLALVGPPGVGKTSLGRSIAEALGRPFVRISLGGISDEVEIRGHRRTYLGAMPGRIMQALLRSGSNRPLIVLDEIDKLGPQSKGDPAAALLDVLDPEQQHEFVDHYVDLPFDISSALFIATANSLDNIPEALLDRLEVIRLAGYTEEEKIEIALRHIIPRQMEWHALTGEDLAWRRDGIRDLIESYTQEAGVRQLEREIATICRRVATMVAAQAQTGRKLHTTRKAIRKLLGTPRFASRELDPRLPTGVAAGLFWTPAGGELMHIEAAIMAGSKTLTITGQLGNVMRESAQTALSYVRACADDLGIDPDFFESHDLHLHVPSGDVAKDGPSAGITLTTAFVSLLTGQAVEPGVAMTGEITLKGRVLAVGGVNEKLLAARRACVSTVILPAENRADVNDIQPELLGDLRIVFVESFDDVLQAAFVGLPKHRQAASERSRGRIPAKQRRLANGSAAARSNK